jgi:hypothetical protein
MNFSEFLTVMRGKRLLHLGHKEADCDALGSAYAMSCVLSGDLGFAGGLKATAQDLADHIGIQVLTDPDPGTYDCTIIYDTYSAHLLGLPLPDRFALFDHHEPGGHRFSRLNSKLAGSAEWAFVQPVESTCSLLVDLFLEHGVTITPDMALALAAGIVTDTIWLRNADAAALRRLAVLLEAADLYVEGVLAVVDGAGRKSARRPVVLDAIHGLQEHNSGGWSILSAETDSLDYGFAVTEALNHLGGDVCVVAFPRNGYAMVMAECRASLVEHIGIDLAGLMKEVAPVVSARETWGTRELGRIVAPAPVSQLLDVCVNSISEALEGTRKG